MLDWGGLATAGAGRRVAGSRVLVLVVFRVIQHALGALLDTNPLTVSDRISISMLSASNTCGLPGPFGEKISPTVFEAYLQPRLEEPRKYCLIA